MLEDNDLIQIRDMMLNTFEPLFTRIFNKLDSHDNNFKYIEREITGLKTDISGLKALQPMIEESHRWLGMLIENKVSKSGNG